MNRLISSLAASSALFASAESQACSCFALADTFFETVVAHNEKVQSGEWPESNSLTVVTGMVGEHLSLRGRNFATEMVFNVDHVIQGELASSQIIVEGDLGYQCRPYIATFPVGETFVLAVSKVHDDNTGPGGQEHYSVSICGQYYQRTTSPR